jgi:hypothetical protein
MEPPIDDSKKRIRDDSAAYVSNLRQNFLLLCRRVELFSLADANFAIRTVHKIFLMRKELNMRNL